MKIIPVPGNTFQDSPIWWQNLITDVEDSWDAIHPIEYADLSEPSKDAAINEKLQKFHAHIIVENDTHVIGIAFNDEKYLTAFLLKYNYDILSI
jgi:hypothetical protein